MFTANYISTLRHGGYTAVCFACGVGNIDPQPIDEMDNDHRIHQPIYPWGVKLACGTMAGGSAALLSNPTDVSDSYASRQSLAKRTETLLFKCSRRYSKIIRQEKLKSLWTGCTPNVLRATLITSTQIPSYYFAKEFFSDIFRLRKNEFTLHFYLKLIFSYRCIGGYSPLSTL